VVDLLHAWPAAGRESDLVRRVRRLARDAAARRRESVLLVEGIHPAAEALVDRDRIRLALASPRLLRTEEGRRVAGLAGGGPFPARRLTDRLMDALTDAATHQGILLLAERPSWTIRALVSAPGPAAVLVACAVQDPGNLGALARAAEAAWATGMVCAGPGADPYAPRSLRAAAGSLPRLPVVESEDPVLAAAELRAAGLRLLGASARAAAGYRAAALDAPFALFVGSEGGGLPAGVAAAMDAEIAVPMRAGVESLNVAAAAAVILFEAAARRGRF
jgi:TrmH family RNA methyltransferase